jgi:hypothetical protein
MANNSDLNLTKTPTVTVAAGSLESIFLNSGAAKRINVKLRNESAVIDTGRVGTPGETDPNLVGEDGGEDGESGGNDFLNSIKPQLADISVFANEIYIDAKGNARARLVLKIKNSSGKSLLGVDTLLINLKEGA